MSELVKTIIEKLRDHAEIVAKTAKKLLLELQKCYPQYFASNYIEPIANPEEKHICELIIDNKFDEAQRIINVTSSSSKRVSAKAQLQPALSNNTGNAGDPIAAHVKSLMTQSSIGAP